MVEVLSRKVDWFRPEPWSTAIVYPMTDPKECPMGLIGKILAAKLVAKLTERLDRAQRGPPARAEYIPAGDGKQAGARGNALVDRAGRLYHRNPKLIVTLGAAALALIAAGMSRRRGS